MNGLDALGDFLEKAGGPFIGPKGGKWADAKHTIAWKEGGPAKPGKKPDAKTEHEPADLGKKLLGAQQHRNLLRTAVETARKRGGAENEKLASHFEGQAKEIDDEIRALKIRIAVKQKPTKTEKSMSGITDLEDYLSKGGEGSRGGHVVGHTAGGKPIYDSKKVGKELANLKTWVKTKQRFLRQMETDMRRSKKTKRLMQSQYDEHKSALTRAEGRIREMEQSAAGTGGKPARDPFAAGKKLSEGKTALEVHNPPAAAAQRAKGKIMGKSATDGITGLEDYLSKGGPYIGPRGGKWADAKHTIPWSDHAAREKLSHKEVHESASKIKEGMTVTYQGETGTVRRIEGDSAKVMFQGAGQEDRILTHRLKPKIEAAKGKSTADKKAKDEMESGARAAVIGDHFKAIDHYDEALKHLIAHYGDKKKAHEKLIAHHDSEQENDKKAGAKSQFHSLQAKTRRNDLRLGHYMAAGESGKTEKSMSGLTDLESYWQKSQGPRSADDLRKSMFGKYPSTGRSDGITKWADQFYSTSQLQVDALKLVKEAMAIDAERDAWNSRNDKLSWRERQDLGKTERDAYDKKVEEGSKRFDDREAKVSENMAALERKLVDAMIDQAEIEAAQKKVTKSLDATEILEDYLSKAAGHKYTSKKPDGKGGWNYKYASDKNSGSKFPGSEKLKPHTIEIKGKPYRASERKYGMLLLIGSDGRKLVLTPKIGRDADGVLGYTGEYDCHAPQGDRIRRIYTDMTFRRDGGKVVASGPVEKTKKSLNATEILEDYLSKSQDGKPAETELQKSVPPVSDTDAAVMRYMGDDPVSKSIDLRGRSDLDVARARQAAVARGQVAARDEIVAVSGPGTGNAASLLNKARNIKPGYGSPTVPLLNQHTLCKSCGTQRTAVLTTCPSCGGGHVVPLGHDRREPIRPAKGPQNEVLSDRTKV